MSQDCRHRDQQYQLPKQGDAKTHPGMTQGLEGRTQDHGHTRKDKTEGNDAQTWNANGIHVLIGVEQRQQRPGDQLKQDGSCQHDRRGHHQREPDCREYPVFASGTEVEGHNGNQGIGESHDDHEHKLLEFDVHTEDRDSHGGKRHQDPVHEHRHETHDSLHDHGGDANLQNTQHKRPIPPEFPDIHVDLRDFSVRYPDPQAHGGDLADHRGDCRSGDSEIESEDEDRIQDDVDQCPGSLDREIVHRPACRLHDALKGDLEENREGEPAADLQVGIPLGNDLRFPGEEPEKPARSQEPEGQEQQPADQRQQHAIEDGLTGHLRFLFPEIPRQDCIESYADTAGYGNHQRLDGIAETDGKQGLLGVAGDEHAVNDVVQSRQKHAQGYGNGHRNHQMADVHGFQFVH